MLYHHLCTDVSVAIQAVETGFALQEGGGHKLPDMGSNNLKLQQIAGRSAMEKHLKSLHSSGENLKKLSF